MKVFENELNKFDVNKEHWEEILKVNRKKLLLVFLAGATAATIIWLAVFFIYTQTGFIL